MKNRKQNTEMTTSATATDLDTLDNVWKNAAAAWLMNFDSDRTRRVYGDTWQLFMSVTGATPATATQSDVIAFSEYMKTEMDYSQSSINLRLSAVSSFFRFAIGRGLRSDNPADGVKRKAVNPYGKATYMKAAETMAFLNAIETVTTQGKRDYAMFLVMLTTGVRVSAVSNLRYGDIIRRAGETFFNYRNKGGAVEKAPLNPNTWQALSEYLDTRDNLTAESPVFVATGRGRKAAENLADVNGATTEKPLSVTMINKLIKKYANRAFGDGHNITAHSLRHTTAVSANRAGANTAQVQRIMKHSSPQTTQIYLDHVASEEIDQLYTALDDLYGKAPR